MYTYNKYAHVDWPAAAISRSKLKIFLQEYKYYIRINIIIKMISAIRIVYVTQISLFNNNSNRLQIYQKKTMMMSIRAV